VKIALFTPFSPEIGGGAAQLRSHLKFLPELDVTWYYLAPKPEAQQQPNWKWLGQRLTPGEVLFDFGARSGVLTGSKRRTKQIVDQMPADLHWVIGHYEGISVAAELQAQGKPVHLTIHDDPFGTWIRSKRYTWFRPLLQRVFPRILRGARNVDVTSWGMRNLYREKYGLKCFSVYLHVPELPRLPVLPDPTTLSIGHIGTLYQREPFRRFLSACKRVADGQRRTLRVIRIGASPEIDPVAREFSGAFESFGDSSEEGAVPLLAACDLLYAMYPPGKKYELFRRTSLPIKLSTYTKAQRPIFAHTPADSTLARTVEPCGAGSVCESMDVNEIHKKIQAALAERIPRERFELLRSEVMGFEQIQQLGAALRGEDWSCYPEHDFWR
jgi:hypothetical protein